MVRHKFCEQLAVTAILLSTLLPAHGEETKPGTDPHKNGDASITPSMDPVTTTTTTTTSSSSTDPTKSDSTSTAPSALPANWVPAKPTPDKPKEKPAPAGQAAAVKLYSERKYAAAAAQFEKFIKDGSANSETHDYLAYCEYSQRHYTKALKQFDWVAKWTPDNYKLRTSAERAGAMLRGQMAGVCPQPCLKTNDPRWQRVGDHREIHWNITGGWVGVTDHHMGQLISVKNNQIVNGGNCPTCGGSGQVTPLKDGDPIPR